MAFGSSDIPWSFVWWMRRCVTTAPVSLSSLLLGIVSLRLVLILLIQTETKFSWGLWIINLSTWYHFPLLRHKGWNGWHPFAKSGSSKCPLASLSWVIILCENWKTNLISNTWQTFALPARWDSAHYIFCANLTLMIVWIRYLECYHEEFQGQTKYWMTLIPSPLSLMSYLDLVSEHGWARGVNFMWKNWIVSGTLLASLKWFISNQNSQLTKFKVSCLIVA